MVKQINWSPLAKEEFRNLLLSSLQKHGNKEQGKVIYSLFKNALHRITLNPFIAPPRLYAILPPQPSENRSTGALEQQPQSRKDKDHSQRKPKVLKRVLVLIPSFRGTLRRRIPSLVCKEKGFFTSLRMTG